MRNLIDAFVGSTHRKLKAFRNNQLGSITQIAAVAAVPMFLCAGAAIDTVRVNREQVAFTPRWIPLPWPLPPTTAPALRD